MLELCMLNKYAIMNTPLKKRNPLARELWSAKYRRSVENKLVYKRRPKHAHRSSELVQY